MNKENEENLEEEGVVTEEAKTSASSATHDSEEMDADQTSAESVEEASSSFTELEKAQNEAAEMKVRYLRAVADLENYRKRISREKQEIIRSAAASVVESLLPVLDNMKLGLQAAENHPEAKDVTLGFKMVDDQLKKSLSEQGLEEVIPNGETFDPNLHECIAHQPSETIEEDKVIETVRAGYRLNERLIRAANVVVSSGPATNED